MNQRNHMKYRPDIDGLRAIAVWAVLFFHAFPTKFHGGFVGVDIFFVISGYLISNILFENMEDGNFTFRDFYSRRIRRIFPALILVMTVTIIAGWGILVADEMSQLGLHIAAGAGFISNLIVWGEAGYFDTASALKPLLHLWSLGIEEQFYIFWPLLLWGALKFRISFLLLTILIAFGSFTLNVTMISSDPTATFYSPATRAWELLCGTILAWLSLYSTRLNHETAPWRAHILSLCGSTLLIVAMILMEKNRAFPGWWALLPVLGAVCLIASGPQGVINKHILSSRPMVWFGLISFPLYLWHWPLLSFGQIVYGEQTKLGFRVMALLLSVLLAGLTVRFFERPLRNGTASNNIKVGVLCTLMALLGAVGLWINHMDLQGSHTFETRLVQREVKAVGESLGWYHGKEDWLFLGNLHNRGVEKLTGDLSPAPEEIKNMKAQFAAIAESASRHNIDVALLLGPNKASIYPEYLPDAVRPSEKRYSTAFVDALISIPNLTVHDPVSSLLAAKVTEGLLYYRTDTHWNSKGAFLAYASLQRQLGLPVLDVAFTEGATHAGDLIGISKLENHPLHSGDVWQAVYEKAAVLDITLNSGEPKTSFSNAGKVVNKEPLIDEIIWVTGDSFTSALREYLNATYREVIYIGHWSDKLDILPKMINEATEKPDRVWVVRVERSF